MRTILDRENHLFQSVLRHRDNHEPHPYGLKSSSKLKGGGIFDKVSYSF